MARETPISADVWPELAFFAAQVRKAREEKRMTQAQLAEVVGTAPTYISSLEGLKVNPTFQQMVTFALKLEKPLSYFILDR